MNIASINSTLTPGRCLDPYILSFDDVLRAKRYTAGTIKNYRVFVRVLATRMEANGLAVGEQTPEAAASLVRGDDHDARRPTWNQNLARRFVQHLIEIGAVPPPRTTPQELARRHLLAAFRQYLEHQRGLCERRIYGAVRMADRFLRHRFGEGDLNTGVIMPGDIISFLHHLMGSGGRMRNTAAMSLVRLFLQFLFSSGATGRNLALCIPKVAYRRYSHVPRYLAVPEVEKVIEAVRLHSKHRKRGYAMILLMARLGLRAPEVVAIQLDDIDWRAGELLVRGKGGRHDRVPLPSEVGEAIADYIQHERASASRALFVKRQADYGPFKDGQILNAVLKEAFRSCGVKPNGAYIGSHILRHSLATAMVRGGASLQEIGDLLRHRCRATTMIYAKVDLSGLNSIAQAWPREGGIQ
jgi:integrase/recombinase XerD